MKKFLTIFIFIISICNTNLAFAGTTSDLSKIEEAIFGQTYENETEAYRLDRAEKEIFGTTNATLQTDKRIDRITKSLGLETTEDEKKSAAELYIPEKAGQGAEYPQVDMLENTLLGSIYKTDDINTRLERLENKVFGAKQNGDLSDRTDALKRYMKGGSIDTKMVEQPYYSSYERTFDPDSDETKLQLSALENMIYGTTFSSETVDRRLVRLENKIFQRSFTEDDTNMRIQRIQAAATAGKTAKYYDGNKFQKFASTGMQLGTFILMILAFIL